MLVIGLPPEAWKVLKTVTPTLLRKGAPREAVSLRLSGARPRRQGARGRKGHPGVREDYASQALEAKGAAEGWSSGSSVVLRGEDQAALPSQRAASEEPEPSARGRVS